MSKKKINFLLIAGMIIGIIVIALMRKYYLEKYPMITIGKIEYCESVKDPNVFVIFTISNDGNTEQGKTPIPKTDSYLHLSFLDSFLRNKMLPVVFQKGRPGNNRMLFNRKDCGKFKVILDKDEVATIFTIDSVINNIK